MKLDELLQQLPAGTITSHIPETGAPELRLNGDRLAYLVNVTKRGSECTALARYLTHAANVLPAAVAALEECDAAFAAWQVGQIPGRPEDILRLIALVRSALAQATEVPD